MICIEYYMCKSASAFLVSLLPANLVRMQEASTTFDQEATEAPALQDMQGVDGGATW